ncbi:MAG: thioredoxin [Candidatus Thermoplasmatota archaeon]|nr:thioredoxin [Candidatus Thermoplasmatota archaeon]MBS3789602.1 thioredoxin [Candidatus Thermoplasmatota archaeon]
MTDGKNFVETVTEENYKEFLESNEEVVLDLWATWCVPCVHMDPIVEALAEKYEGKVKFGKVNIEEDKNIPSVFDVQSLPSILFIKKGEVKEKVTGKLDEDEFEEKLEKNFDIN